MSDSNGPLIGMPVITPCPNCGRQLPNSLATCPCQSAQLPSPTPAPGPQPAPAPRPLPQPPVTMPVIGKCAHCGRQLANSGVVCPCQGTGIKKPVIEPAPEPGTGTVPPPRLTMPVIRKCSRCGRQLSNSGVVCPCRSVSGGAHPNNEPQG